MIPEDLTWLYIVYIVDKRGPRLVSVENQFARSNKDAELQSVHAHHDELEADLSHYFIHSEAKFGFSVEKESALAQT